MSSSVEVQPRNHGQGRPARDRDAAAEPKDKKHSQFWRATSAIWPYRRIVGISIVCAFFVGAAVSGGLTTMLPILRVLLNGQTVQAWVDSQIVERRLGLKLDEDNSDVRVLDVRPGGAAAAAGLRKFDQLSVPAPAGAGDGRKAERTLHELAAPDRNSVAIAVSGRGEPVSVELPPVKWYLQVGRRIASHVSPHPVWAIGQIFAFIAVLAVFSNVLKYFQEYLSDKAAVLAVMDIRRRLYDHVLHVPMSHLARRGTSEFTSRLVQDSANLEQGFKTVLGQSIQEPIKAAFALGLALVVSWKLTLAILVFGPLMAVIIRKFGKKMRRASRAALQKSSAMLGQIDASLTGIRVVKAAGAERFERRRYRNIMHKLIAEQLRMSRIDAFSAPTLETLTLLVVGGVVLIASYMVLVSNTLTATSFFLVMACLGTIADSLRRLNKVNNVLQKSNAAAQRIFEVMELPTERERGRANEDRGSRIEDRGKGQGNEDVLASSPSSILHPPSSSSRPRVKLAPIQREIRFDGVTFAYPGASQPAITDVDLVVPKGQCVAVVGRNGSGKTTLLALLPRFYDPQRGRVTIDGVDLRGVTLRSLRAQISIVTQDSVIFPGTIAENIAYGNPRAPRDEVIAAAKRAFAHEFILEKPHGYDTLLGEMGGQLSGGQKQRLCIARAILRKSPILILDEATSQVDAESEHLIQQAIEGLMHERTVFVIAHRFSTILNADSIVVMDRGRVVAQGRHEELLAACETYQQLYDRQLFKSPGAARVTDDLAAEPAGSGVA